jgi:hypothetical protein
MTSPFGDVPDDATKKVLDVLSERSFWRLWAEVVRALGVDPGEEPPGLDVTSGTAWKWAKHTKPRRKS